MNFDTRNWRWTQIEEWLLTKYERSSPLVGAEIGVKEGRFSSYLLRKFPNLIMIAVDPRISQLGESETYTDWDWESINNEYKANIEPYIGRLAEYSYYSHEAAEMMENESLDFVFLDAQHDYQSVKRDIACWLPKVKKGGLMSGHDYDPNPERNYGVIPAVNEKFGSVLTGRNFTWGKWI